MTTCQWEIPDGLSQTGQAASITIRDYLAEHDCLDDSGAVGFRTPQQWEAKGEEPLPDAELIILHDGGNVAAAFDTARGDRELKNGLRERLSGQGAVLVQCMSWFSTIETP